ncbi:3-keto-5-aminohexanoate cleavage protein [Brevibacterium ravenspurgense]|uniref:3-keto-5-aminohexanoate cleavage protein n=1 Tax=Brevibacterium ravenspurgense TaxID=479117 RepID=UPI001EF24F5A|nr:3-keto-5-aminohexanoate cleavage protein [Brevibacterium ravenspurgense]MCG7301255.1 3-keto-5-aminohexanoate cleavage protein [Brevibacterium ravenspurgense]
MARKRKIIITCAVTGSIHTPSMSPYLPATSDEISDASIQAAQAGASIVHLHARKPEDGRPSQDPEDFAPMIEKINASTDAVINLTSGGSPHMSVEERMQPAMTFAPELASLNMGSMNFGLFPMLKRFTEFEHEWEREHLENSRDLIFKNTYSDIETILTRGGENGTKFEFECYDTSHLYNLKHFVDEGLAPERPFVQTVLGLLGGTGASAENLLTMRRIANELLGTNYEWSVLGAGRHQMPLGAVSLAAGGHIRVGLEDSLWIGAGEPAKSNAQQVERAVQLVEALGMEVATPDEAREILGLKGKENITI